MLQFYAFSRYTFGSRPSSHLYEESQLFAQVVADWKVLPIPTPHSRSCMLGDGAARRSSALVESKSAQRQPAINTRSYKAG